MSGAHQDALLCKQNRFDLEKLVQDCTAVLDYFNLM